MTIYVNYYSSDVDILSIDGHWNHADVNASEQKINICALNGGRT